MVKSNCSYIIICNLSTALSLFPNIEKKMEKEEEEDGRKEEEEKEEEKEKKSIKMMRDIID